MKYLKLLEFNEEELNLLAKNFSKIAKENDFNIFTCGEKYKFLEFGFISGACLSKTYALSLTKSLNKDVKFKKQTNRKNNYCECVEMVDIGVYNTCLSKCKYCYANFDEENVNLNMKLHDENSSLLIGKLNKEDQIKIRKK